MASAPNPGDYDALADPCCYPGATVSREMRKLFAGLKAAHYSAGLSSEQFAESAAHFLATLNAIHPFCEGNGRTQTAFLDLLSDRAGHPLILERLAPERFLAAMIQSFQGNEGPLREEILTLVAA
jgi:cell filamentation protein, protein adenylyltransferase